MTFPDLLAEADRYARMTMKKHGKLAPVMMAATPEGLILFTPDGLTDTGMKDDFANKVRLITASHEATSVVLMVESWLTRAKPDQPLDQTQRTRAPLAQSLGGRADRSFIASRTVRRVSVIQLGN
jgi:hydroxypyruvate isomerase